MFTIRWCTVFLYISQETILCYFVEKFLKSLSPSLLHPIVDRAFQPQRWFSKLPWAHKSQWAISGIITERAMFLLCFFKHVGRHPMGKQIPPPNRPESSSCSRRTERRDSFPDSRDFPRHMRNLHECIDDSNNLWPRVRKTLKSVLELESPPTVCVAFQQSLNFPAARQGCLFWWESL